MTSTVRLLDPTTGELHRTSLRLGTRRAALGLQLDRGVVPAALARDDTRWALHDEPDVLRTTVPGNVAPVKMFRGRLKWQGQEHGWFKRHSLSLVLVTLMTVQTLYAVWAGSYVFSREQPFGDGVPTFGREFWAWWTWEYNVSLVADTFGVLLIVLLSKWLYEEGSAESNGSDGSRPEPAA